MGLKLWLKKVNCWINNQDEYDFHEDKIIGDYCSYINGRKVKYTIYQCSSCERIRVVDCDHYEVDENKTKEVLDKFNNKNQYIKFEQEQEQKQVEELKMLKYLKEKYE